MHTRLQPHPRLRARAFFICLLFASFSAALFLHLSAQTAHAASGIYKTINFQGKVVNTDGTNVANGSYSFVFSLYDASSGGSQLWTETQTLTVTDGIFRANLGSVTPISSVNFNTDSLYLEINFNSDGVMSPRVRFAAVPYAFEADQVNGLSVTNNGSNTLNIAAGKTLKVDNSIEFIGTDTTAMTLPTLSTTLAGLSIAQTFTNAQTITPTQNSTNALSINGTSGTAATALVVAQTGNASGVSITGSSSETASDLVTITDAVFAPAASATVSGINLSFTNLSTNATGTSTTAGISINPTVNVTSGAGTHTTIGLNFPALTATCTAGTCLKYGLYFPSSNNYTDILNYSGTSVINASGQLNLSSVTNTLGIANGGTNAGSFTATNGVIYYDGSKLASTAASSGTQCLQTASAGAAPTWGSCGSGSSQWTTSGSNIYYTTGKVGIGTTSPNGLLDVSSTTLSGVGTLTGPLLSLSASTYQATTNADMAFNSIAAPTLTAAASQTTTNAYTLYIAGAPTAGTSETISHAFALGVNGNSYLNGNVGIGTTSPAGLLDVSKTLSGAGTLTGPYLSISASTYTATSNADMAFNSIAQPTLQASAFQTTTNAYTLYIAGGPIPGTNELITNALALGVGGSIGIQFGNSLFLYNAGNTAYSAIAFDGTYTNVSWPLRLNINSSNPILTVAQTGTGYAAIFTGGNVGINNTTPTAKLDVGIPTTGTATNIKAPVATTQTGSLTGELIDLNTNFTALAGTNGTTTTGISLKTPTLTESTASVTDSVYGLNLGTTGALTTQTNSSTAINWYGANITMPNITQTAGTLTSTGVSITPGSVTTGGTQYGININTNSASVGTNTAINIGSGWGKAINIPADSTTTAGGITFGTTTPVTIYRSGAGALSMGDGTNSFTVNTTSGPAYAGTARPTKVITLSPEYAGAVLTAFYGAGTDTSITGNMTSDAETSSTNNLRTYYQWTSTQASLNYYTVAVRVTLPQDFSAWAASNPLTIDYDTQSNSSANNSVDARVYLQSNSTTAVTSSTGNASATGGTYATISFTNSNLTGGSVTWNGAGQQAVIYLRVGSLSSNYVRLGDIKLTYLAAY